MAAPNKLDKMAVTVDNSSLNSSVYDVNSQEDTDQKMQGVSAQKSDAMYAKKKSTFKITSVTKSSLSRGEGQNDADADSMDDLDETVESHTEDISSEILDSSKYTDIGDQDTPLEETTQTTFGQESETVSVNKDINKEGKTADAHSTQTRFKVVKIETKEPFKRGRWTCHDLLDDRMVEKSESKTVTTDRDREEQANSGNSSASSSVHYVYGVDDPSKNPLTVGGSQGQALQQNDNFVNQSDDQDDKFISNLPQGILTELSSAPYIQHAQATTSNTQIPTSLQTNQIHNYTGVVNNSAGSPVQNITQTDPEPRNQQSITQGPVQNATSIQNVQAQATTDHVIMPSSQHSNVVTHSGNIQVSSQIPSPVVIPSITGQVQTPIVEGKTPQGQMQQISGVAPVTGGQVPIHINSGSADYVQTPQSATIPQQVTSDVSDKEGSIPQNPGILPSQSDDENTSADRIAKESNPIVFNPSSKLMEMPMSTPILTPLTVAEVVGGMSSPTKEDERWKFKVDKDSMDYFTGTEPGLQTSAECGDQSNTGHMQLKRLDCGVAYPYPLYYWGTGYSNTPDRLRHSNSWPSVNFCNYGSSTVAIDNKIEQAMDLVKSHLMYAVREEVEVLKEQIKELIEKNSQLEHENSILKAAASQETLQKLSQPRQQQPPSSSS